MSTWGRGRGRGRYDSDRRKQALFNKLLNDDTATMRGRHQALRFLEGMEDFDSKSKLLNLMTDERKTGARRIEEILSFVEDILDVEDLLVPLLLHGINQQTSKPLFRAMREKYLHLIYLVPGLIDFLATDEIIEDLDPASAGLICRFLMILSKAIGEARNDESVAKIANGFIQRDTKDAKVLGTILLLKEKDARESHRVKSRRAKDSVDVESEVACWVTDRIPPGNRHTNDHLNFRDVSLIPPADELRCQVPQYLPLANEENSILEDPVSRLLDRNFRLLREDAMSSMRTLISEKRRAWLNARIIGIDSDQGNENSFLVHLDPPHRAVDDWYKVKALNYQSIVAFLDEKGGVQRIGIITISQADKKNEWLNNPIGPVIGISLENEAAFDEAAKEMVLNKKLHLDYINAIKEKNSQLANKILSKMKTYEMVEISRSFFAYHPILKALQSSDGIPFQDELLHAKTPAYPMPSYLPRELRFPKLADRNEFVCENFVEELTADKLVAESTLDTSQAHAVRHVLTSRVALIQGPPGTGKTFIGGLIARILLTNSLEKILCVCYTNHALDQFLEHLIDAGETSIVRLGARTKSDKIEKYQLRSLARLKSRSDGEVNNTIKRIDAQRYKLREELEERLKQIESTVTWSAPNGGVNAVLREDFPDEHDFLSIPVDNSGFQLVGQKGKGMKKDYLWNEWKRGSDIPPFALFANSRREGFVEFWRMPAGEKTDFVKEVELAVLEAPRNRIRELLKQLKDLSSARDTASRVGEMQILNDASIIGATTAGAAKYRDILSEVSPGIVIVEEAGEVLESHVLTSLSSENFDGISEDTKHLILIGDHKQLRPKVETYKLTKVSGGGYNLDVSLFERLILGGLRSASLAVQHRMRPSISEFVRSQTYPGLIDHESVLTFPDIRGVNENVVFIDHDNPEDKQEVDSLDAKRTSTTKANTFEVEMCVEIVRYFLLQGYSPAQIVVLTPYLGQLSKITRAMRKELQNVDAYISEKDLDEFEGDEQDELAGAEKVSKSNTVRCSSVDNYQGEESDIVIASLVRCNENGSIGFLKEPQRVNVLLSRARYGMFIVGSYNTLMGTPAGQKTWSTLFEIMSKKGQIRRGLPTVCTIHPNDPPKELHNKIGFRSIRPNGGCHRPCNFRLSCGHVCPQMCHPVDRDHSFAAKMCSQPCRRVPPECHHQHPCRKRCRDNCGPCSTPMGPFLLPCGHENEHITCHDTRSEEAIANFSRTCSEMVEKSFNCGHVSKTTCRNARSEQPKCPEICNKMLETCNHACKNWCHSCEGKHDCKQKCERMLFCGHVCDRPCHPGEECKPCEKPCMARCTHSKCPKPCGAHCASCVEECDWECEHLGKCELVCGAPCTRLPCNKRCEKLLCCGHHCPSVCGEPCPDKRFCVVCGSNDAKSAFVDLLLMGRYEEHDLDQDPVIFLPCGHFFGIETLDGHLEMDQVYVRSPDTGDYLSTKSLLDADLSDRPKQCPQCRFPLAFVRRYGRILNSIALRGLERKHRSYVERRLKDLSQRPRESRESLKAIFQALSTLRKDIQVSPMQQVQNACLSLQTADSVEVPQSSPSLLIRVIHESAKVGAKATKEVNSKTYNTTNKLFLEAIDIANASQSWRSSASLRIDLVRFLWRWMRYDDPKAPLYAHLDWIANEASVAMTEFATLATDLRREIASDRKEREAAVAAMNVIRGYDYGGGASGHWYECPNGHPYYIGECGQAMEVAKCIECGAQVGGESHRLLGTNRQWQQFPNGQTNRGTTDEW